MRHPTRRCQLQVTAPLESAARIWRRQIGSPHLMTTLVTGATGFVGSHVARQLVAAGHTVRVLVRSTSNLAVLEGLPVEPVAGDLRDAASLDRAVQGARQRFSRGSGLPLVDAAPRGNLREQRRRHATFAECGATRRRRADRLYQHGSDDRGATTRSASERSRPRPRSTK